MNADTIARIEAKYDFEKQLEEMDAMTIYAMMLNPPKNAEITEYEIMKWMGYPIFGALDMSVITWFYEILNGDRDTRTFWTLVKEKYAQEVHEWMVSHGYTSVLARIMTENRPPTEKKGIRL